MNKTPVWPSSIIFHTLEEGITEIPGTAEWSLPSLNGASPRSKKLTGICILPVRYKRRDMNTECRYKDLIFFVIPPVPVNTADRFTYRTDPFSMPLDKRRKRIEKVFQFTSCFYSFSSTHIHSLCYIPFMKCPA